jgi:N-acetylmuramoyl-L-alanine amidase
MKIFIDAGHNYSGWNTGATGNGLREQDVTWEIAKKCSEILATSGFETKLSRPNLTDNLGTDNSSSLAARTKMANDWNADYFVSIHCNAGGGTGTETYCYKAGTTAEKFAQAVNAAVVERMGTRNRGVKVANFYVLTSTKMPAVLVETAFIDYALDALLLKNNKDNFAAAIAEGIMTFVGADIIRPTTPPPSNEVLDARKAINILRGHGIINSPEYWYSALDIVNHLDELLIKIAKII